MSKTSDEKGRTLMKEEKRLDVEKEREEKDQSGTRLVVKLRINVQIRAEKRPCARRLLLVLVLLPVGIEYHDE